MRVREACELFLKYSMEWDLSAKSQYFRERYHYFPFSKNEDTGRNVDWELLWFYKYLKETLSLIYLDLSS